MVNLSPTRFELSLSRQIKEKKENKMEIPAVFRIFFLLFQDLTNSSNQNLRHCKVQLKVSNYMSLTHMVILEL